MIKTLRLIATLAAALTLAPAAMAQAYPSKPVKIIVPFSAGTAADIVARRLGTRLSEIWGQGVVIENLAGAGGNIGAGKVAQSAPDGYTLMMVGINHVINPSLYKDVPYDLARDFRPVVRVAVAPLAIVANSKFGPNNMQELIAPLGERSVAGSWPHLGYQTWPADQVRKLLNDMTTVVVMLETPEAIEHADEIAAVPGVDILHVGSTDLCDALGMPGKFGDPALERSFERVIQACRAHGKYAGAGGLGTATDVMQKVIRMGVRFVTAGTEWALMMAAARQRATLLRQMSLD